MILVPLKCTILRFDKSVSRQSGLRSRFSVAVKISAGDVYTAGFMAYICSKGVCKHLWGSEDLSATYDTQPTVSIYRPLAMMMLFASGLLQSRIWL